MHIIGIVYIFDPNVLLIMKPLTLSMSTHNVMACIGFYIPGVSFTKNGSDF